MPDLRLHNSLTRRRETFVPLDPGHVRLYLCGPTVYDLAHVGNARPVVVFDVLVRLLRRLYSRVTYVRNITDVDDKINARAAESGEPIGAITARTTADFHADIAALVGFGTRHTASDTTSPTRGTSSGLRTGSRCAAQPRSRRSSRGPWAASSRPPA